MEESNKFIEKNTSYNTIIEVKDDSNDFIPYWNLAMKDRLSKYLITIGTEQNKSREKPLNRFNIKLIDKKESFSPEKGDIIQLDKLFIINIYRIKKEKEFNKVIKKYQVDHNTNDLNVILYNIDEINENTLNNINSIKEKIKNKIGVSDFSFLPYNMKNFGKFDSEINKFFTNLINKIATGYNTQLEIFTKKLNVENIINGDIELIYEYIKNKILYLDLLNMGEFWDDICKTCFVDIFKTFDKINNKFFLNHFSNITELNILEIKKNAKYITLTNIEFQLFLVYNYIESCKHLKDYNSLSNCLYTFSIKLNFNESSFQSVYHFFYWKIKLILSFINYLISSKEKINQKDVNFKHIIDQGIINLYTLVLKELKVYGSKLKIEIPSIKILILLKNSLEKNINIKEELDKILTVDLGEIEKDNIFQIFKSDIKLINDNEKDKNNMFNIFINKKDFLEEYLLILKNINKNNSELFYGNNSIREAFNIIPLLLVLNKLEEAKNFLLSLLEEKFLKNTNKWNFTYQYICFILIIVLNSLEKNKENLNIMIKLLDTNFSKINYFLKLLESNDENLINDLISKYIESFIVMKNDNREDKLDNIIFSLDKIIDIKLEKIKDSFKFINKSKTKKVNINYKFTNNTGINLNLDKIQLIFEEIYSINNNNKKEKNQIIYELERKSNTFKSLIPYAKEQENTFVIILDESNDSFQLNTIYKFKEIKYITKNSLYGIFHIKDDYKICLNSIDMKISTQIYPSYFESNFLEEIKNNFYFNVLSKIVINLTDIPSQEELNNKSLKFIFEDINKKDENIFIIQTHLLKEKLTKIFPNVIIENSSIEFPAGSIKEKEKLENIIIPFYVENINFYLNGLISIRIIAHIFDKNDKDKIIYSYASNHNINLIHLFNIREKFRLLNNKYLMQTTFSLNVETNNIKVYNNSEDYYFFIDTTQAINYVLELYKKQNEIIKQLRQNFLEFGIELKNIKKLKEEKEEKEQKKDKNNKNDEKESEESEGKRTKDKKKDKKEEKDEESKILVKYRLCYPEKSIIDEIRELKDIPYIITIDVENCPHNILKELNININIKKKNNKSVIFLTQINEDDNWAVIGKTKMVEEWLNDEKENNNEKNLSIQILPLVDGFLKLPEIEFFEYEIQNKENGIQDDNKEREEEMIIGKMNFEPIELGSVIEGNEKVIKIIPFKESSLKLNLS